MKRFLFALALALSLGSLLQPPEAATGEAWLVGRWELFRDPDKEPKDYMEFTPDGKLLIYDANKKLRYDGAYKVHENGIGTVINIKEIPVTTPMKYSADKKTLYYKSPKTGNTAEYRKIQ
ncbi:hypothetical protein BWI17_21415 [Betaproteobacteria bacterium GR16-43]|nr:hypothetical protein BWI17_21415 [Betaproteobacteria bacterium GR16-43]